MMKKVCLFFALVLFSTVHPLLGEVDSSKLTVRGEATLYAYPDEVDLSIGVVTENETAEKALADNTTKMRAIVKGLIKLGLDKNALQTGRFSIRPLYAKELPQVTVRKIHAYQVTNQLRIRTDKIPLAGSIIDEAVTEGANSIDNVQFHLKDPQLLRQDVIQQATENALFKAYTLAEAAQLKLVRILSLTLDSLDSHPRAALYMAKGTGTPIEPGQLAINASVQVIYEVEEQP